MKNLWLLIKKNPWISLLLAITVVSLIALLIPAFYASPSADDFSQSSIMHNLLPKDYNLIDYSKVVVKRSFEIYGTIQGAYTVNILIPLNPMVYKMSLVNYVYILNFLFFIFANYYLVDTIIRKVLGGERKASLAVTSIFLLASLQFLQLGETFYWYAGIIGYTLPYSVTLLFIANLLLIYKQNNTKWRLPLSAVLAFLIAGTNYPLGLFLTSLGFFAILYLLIVRSKKYLPLLLTEIVLVAGFAINVLSPGNQARAAYPVFHIRTPLETIAISGEDLIMQLAKILTWTLTIFFLILLIPLMTGVIKRSAANFQKPFIISFVSLVVLPTVYMPLNYVGAEHAFPARYYNLAFMVIMLVLFINAFYWLGWWIKNNQKDLDIKKYGVLFVLILALSLQQPIASGKIKNPASLVAARETATGVLSNYRNQVNELYRTLEASPDGSVLVYFNASPQSIKPIHLNKDKAFWENAGLAHYFKVKSISNESASE